MNRDAELMDCERYDKIALNLLSVVSRVIAWGTVIHSAIAILAFDFVLTAFLM